MFTAPRTDSRSASEPPKRRSSVSTLMMLAPAFWYCSASFAGSAIEANAPLLGDDLFTSAITLISSPRRPGCASITSGALSNFSRNSLSGRRRLAKSSRTPAMIESSTLMASALPWDQSHDLERSMAYELLACVHNEMKVKNVYSKKSQSHQ